MTMVIIGSFFYFALFSGYSSFQVGAGLAEKKFVDKNRNRLLQTYIWFQTVSVNFEEYGSNRVFKGFFASSGSEVSVTGRVPLIILVHGTSGNWKNLSWLAVELAVKGAIVIAANHPGSTTGDANPASVIKTWNQPEDVSFLIDCMLNSEYSRFIDESRIVVIGNSLGGYTALALAGAVLDFKRFPEFCNSNEDDACKYFKAAFDSFDKRFYKKANLNYRDGRVKAAIALVPGFVESLTELSIRSLETPVLIMGAEHDKNVPPASHFRPYVKHLPNHGQYVEIAAASHFSFLQLCQPGAIEILAEDGEAFVCRDGGSKSRGEIHHEVFGLIELFLKRNNIFGP